MRRIGICVLAILLSQTISASSTPCEEGIRILNSTDTRNCLHKCGKSSSGRGPRPGGNLSVGMKKAASFMLQTQ